MIRVILFLVTVAALGLGFGWLADRPGDLVFTFAGQRYDVTLMVAASLIVAIIAAVMLLWWLIASLIRSPFALKRHFRARKRDRGYQSLSTGLIAAGAGDAQAARKMSLQASKLLRADQEPLIRLLDVQTALLEGRTDDVRKHFEAMIADPETKLLGLRGLYLEASREGVREAAFQYAQEASLVAPQLEWASNAVLSHKTLEGDWTGALQVLERRKDTLPFGKEGKQGREAAKHDRGVLLTAQAIASFDRDAANARSIALEAHKLVPDLIPAAIIAARTLLRDGEMRKACKILEAAWKQMPHPEVAETYLYARTGDSALDRLKKARQLLALRSHSAESFYVVAKAALDAGELKLARENCETAISIDPRESAYLLMADIEEAQTGDQGRIRQWLSAALKAPRDPAWTADGIVSHSWAPVSPVSGRLNAFEWKVPLSQIGALEGPVIDNMAMDAKIPQGADLMSQSVKLNADQAVHVKKVVQLPVIVDAEPVNVKPTVADEVLPVSSVNIATQSKYKPEAVSVVKPTEETPVHRLVVDDPGVVKNNNKPVENSKFRLF